MKRVEAACICQTLRFIPKDSTQSVGKEIEYYKRKLEASRTEYKIVEQMEQPDGSVIVKVIKQYNYSPIGDYLK